jgi:hypothetical protein
VVNFPQYLLFKLRQYCEWHFVPFTASRGFHPNGSYADGVDGSCTIGVKCAILQLLSAAHERSHPMHVTTIGLDLAKNVFQVHGITDNGEVAFKPYKVRAA